MIDLHIHLNGSISAEDILKLASMQNITLPTTDITQINKLISVDKSCPSLNQYLTCSELTRLVTQTHLGIEQGVKLILEKLKDEGLIYCELRFAPSLQTANGLTQEDSVLAALSGINQVPEIKANLILCLMRGKDTHNANIETINIAEKYLGKGVVGIDLAGAEAIFPTKDYQKEFELARTKNIPITIHAGEADGAESVTAALDFGASRIGHGIRSIEDQTLLNRLKNQHTTIEMCPSSNFHTKAVDNIQDYPFRKFLDMGLCVTINTDNKVISNTSLQEEFNFIRQHYNLSKEEELTLLLNSVNGAFISNYEKEELKQKILNKYK